MAEQRDSLMSALSALHVDGKYSDLTINCKNRQWAVHRAIVCSRSTFFDSACSSQFLESKTGVIDISEEDEEAIDHLIHYLYYLDYAIDSDGISDSKRTPVPRHQNTTHKLPAQIASRREAIDPLFAQAATYAPPTPTSPEPQSLAPQVPASQSPASPIDARSASPKSRLRVASPDKHRASPDSESVCDADEEYETDDSHLLAHTRVYALAEKYDIPALKSLAQDKFEVAMACYFDSPELADAIREVYISTIDTDRGLRNVVLQAFRTHPQLANTQDVYAVIKSTPSLAFELWKTERGIPV